MIPINFLTGSEKKFYEFMAELNEKDKIAVISHIDPDGLCSAIIASRVIGKVDFVKFIDYKAGMLKEPILELKKRKINRVFFLDLSIDSEREDVREIEKFAEIAVIDHHPFKNDLNSERTVFIKAETRYPASYMCYYLFSKMQQIPSWIAAIGIVGDNPQIYNSKNSQNVFEDFNLADKQDIWKAAEIIGLSFIYFRGREGKVFDTFMNAGKIEELYALEKYADKVRKDFEEQLAKFEKEKEVYGDLVIFYMTPKYYVKSLLANKISSENQDKSFIFISDRGEGIVSASGRSQDKEIDVGEFLKKAIEGIEGASAGGHFHAAAAKFPSKYFSKFKENLIKTYRILKQ